MTYGCLKCRTTTVDLHSPSMWAADRVGRFTYQAAERSAGFPDRVSPAVLGRRQRGGQVVAQTDAWGDMHEVIARARAEHGNLACFDQLDELICAKAAERQPAVDGLLAIHTIAAGLLAAAGRIEE